MSGRGRHRRSRWLGLALLAMAGAGCHWDNTQYVRPTITVLPFENVAVNQLAPTYDLAHGLSQLLGDALDDSGKFVVVEPGRLQAPVVPGVPNAPRYRVRASIHEFGHFRRNRSWFEKNIQKKSTEDATVNITLLLEDTSKPDTLLARETIEALVPAGKNTFEIAYVGVSFGSVNFRHTPLGRATRQVMDRAVEIIYQHIGGRVWEPKIARMGEGGLVFINGGRDRQMRTGWLFEAVEPGGAILDPDSGDRLGQAEPKPIAEVEITDVRQRYSIGRIRRGGPVAVGQVLRRARKL